MSQLRELWSSRELLANLTLREVRGQYKRTIFGQLWSLVNPLALMLIYTFVFGFVFRAKPDPGDPSGLDVFAIWLLCGLLPWTFFANVVQTSMGSLIANAGLIQKVYFPRIVLPLSTVGSIGFNWLFEMAVLLIALSIAGSLVVLWIPALILAMAALAVFAAGLGLMLGVANVAFRDTQWFVSIGIQMWFYLTPIIYPDSLVENASKSLGPILGGPLHLADIYHWNPMWQFTEVFRAILYDNRIPDLSNILWSLLWAALSFTIGLALFRRSEGRLAEAL